MEGATMMKIGITYLYTICNYGYPPKFSDELKAIEKISEMGFHFLEMEALGEKHTETVSANRAEFRKKLNDCGVHVHNFCIVNPNLVSLDQEKRREAYNSFERTIELGAYFEPETIHLASYAPPVEYKSVKPYDLEKGEYGFADDLRIHVPNDLDWRKVWDTLVESCQFSAKQAAKYGKIILMEPRVGEIICSVDSLIRLINDVNEPNFKANFDTAHLSAQRECVPLALAKLKGMFANIHIADNTPVNMEHITVGKGSIDWEEFFRVLKNMNYEGYLGLDLSASDSIEKDLAESASYIKKICEKQGIKVEM